jgi:hypothetical protein
MQNNSKYNMKYIDIVNPKRVDKSPDKIISLVETDNGSVEMIYDEGYRGDNALETSSKFLTENLGISSLILRSLIFLDGK